MLTTKPSAVPELCVCCILSKADIAVRENHVTATGNHMPYGITQCYLPATSADFPAFTPAEAGTRSSDRGGMQG